MAVLACPHCGSTTIVVGNDAWDDICPRLTCRAVMDQQETEAEAKAKILAAILRHDGAAPIATGARP